jgi:hypothetical protein
MAPGVAAMLQYHVVGPAALGMCAVVAIVFSVAIVAWTMLLGLVVSRFVGIPWLHRYSQEIVASGGIVLNWLALVGITDMSPFRHVSPFMQQLPAVCAARILELDFSGDAVPIEDLVMHLAWAAVPCAVLFVLPLRRPTLVARTTDASRVRAADTQVVIAREPVRSGAKFRRFHVSSFATKHRSLRRDRIHLGLRAGWLFAFVADFAARPDCDEPVHEQVWRNSGGPRCAF